MTTLILLIILGIGISVGYYAVPNHWLDEIDQVANIALHLMVFCVGVTLGRHKTIIKEIKELGWGVLIFPLGTITGSLIGGALAALLIGFTVTDGLAIGSGMGYYSLAGTLLYQLKGVEVGMVAFLSNFLRETFTFLMIPLLVRLNPSTAISLGGATTMDMTLPMIRRYTNSQYTLIAFVHGVVLTFIVPILLNLLAIR